MPPPGGGAVLYGSPFLVKVRLCWDAEFELMGGRGLQVDGA